jgi:hypothetical protein
LRSLRSYFVPLFSMWQRCRQTSVSQRMRKISSIQAAPIFFFDFSTSLQTKRGCVA